MTDTALLVVDAQTALVNEHLYQRERFVRNVSALIAAARANGVRVVYIRHDDGAESPLTTGKPGFAIYPGFAPRPGERIFDKTVNSPFRDTGLTGFLRENGIRTVAVCGLQTDYCIDAAVKCGFEHGFHMIVPQGANSTFDNEYLTAAQTVQYYNEFLWNGRYAECISTDEAIRRIGGRG